MATRFKSLANVRLLWQQPGTIPATFRQGARPTTTAAVVIEAFLKGNSGGGETPTPSAGIGGEPWSGYLTRWALLPTGASWLDIGSSWSWDETGTRPSGLRRGMSCQAFVGNLLLLPVVGAGIQGQMELSSLEGTYGVGGIGARLLPRTGERMAATFRPRV